MNIQKDFDNAIEAERAEQMKTSPQLTLGEMISKLQNIKNKNLPVFFDDTQLRPTSIGSWRGSYRELAISYQREGAYDGFLSEKVEHTFQDETNLYKTESTLLPENVLAQDLLNMLEKTNGKKFYGYKGGEYLMSKTTPVWIANYSTSTGFKDNEQGLDEIYEQAIVDIIEKKDKVEIITKLLKY